MNTSYPLPSPDLVIRLRAWYNLPSYNLEEVAHVLIDEAADEIERLRTIIDELDESHLLDWYTPRRPEVTDVTEQTPDERFAKLVREHDPLACTAFACPLCIAAMVPDGEDRV